MSNLQKYNDVFKQCLGVTEDNLNSQLTYQSVEDWDSVGHMNLIAELEDCFEIMMETEDIIDFNSYEKGKEILLKYQITL
ncbi:MAG: acyl carrier protein [Cellulosilyticum sp.]|nr:acyl carrier protein [Cellulosilyticum sp.]